MKLIERLISGRLILSALIILSEFIKILRSNVKQDFQDSLKKIGEHIATREVICTRQNTCRLADIPHIRDTFMVCTTTNMCLQT